MMQWLKHCTANLRVVRLKLTHAVWLRYNMKLEITRSDPGARIMESITGHVYLKWHEIRNCLIKYFEII